MDVFKAVTNQDGVLNIHLVLHSTLNFDDMMAANYIDSANHVMAGGSARRCEVSERKVVTPSRTCQRNTSASFFPPKLRHTFFKMAPKRIHGEKPRRAPKGFLASTYDTLTSPDNAAVVRSIAMFGVSLQKAHRIRRCDKYETNHCPLRPLSLFLPVPGASCYCLRMHHTSRLRVRVTTKC